jgi:general secretion pathway protein A
MYAHFFGLKQAPFSIAPDPRYLYMSERHREALAHLLYGVGGGGGFVVLTGEIGAGKTTVCRCFLEQIPRRCNVAYIFNPKMTVAELLKSVCDEFRIPYAHQGEGQATIKDYVDPLNEYLLKTHAVGQNNVLIIDEAQNLSPDVLEQLRLLTNLETSERKLLQIMLIGQPELRTMLARPELEQLAQRVIAHFHLEALSEPETGQYIQHRLSVAGLKRGKLFDSKSVHRIHQLSGGVPRRINLLCDRALLGAYAEGKNRVDRQIVDKAAHEVFQTPPPASHRASRSKGLLAGFARLAGKAGQARTGNPGSTQDWHVWLYTGAALTTLAGLGGAWWQHQAHSKTASAAGNAASGLARSGQREGKALSAPPMPPGSAASASAQASAGSSVQAGSASTVQARWPASAAPASPLAPPHTEAATAAMVYAAAWRHERDAWRALAPLWQITLGDSEPCGLAMKQALACFRNSGGLALIRQLERPVILMLRDDKGAAAYALLTGLQGSQAILQVQGHHYALPLGELSAMWRGDFATLWHTPPAFRSKILPGDKGPVVDWLATQIAHIDQSAPPQGKQVFDAAMQSRVYAFQMAQGLKPDGVVGATTFMQINRAIGLPEPRLMTAPATAK